VFDLSPPCPPCLYLMERGERYGAWYRVWSRVEIGDTWHIIMES